MKKFVRLVISPLPHVLLISGLLSIEIQAVIAAEFTESVVTSADVYDDDTVGISEGDQTPFAIVPLLDFDIVPLIDVVPDPVATSILEEEPVPSSNFERINKSVSDAISFVYADFSFKTVSNPFAVFHIRNMSISNALFAFPYNDIVSTLNVLER